MPEVCVLIADDQQLPCQSLAHLLDSQPGFRVVTEAATGAKIVPLARELVPDAVLMGVRMLQLGEVAAICSIVRDSYLSEVRVLVLTMFGLDEYVLGTLRAGVSGLLLRNVTPEVLINAVRAVSAGQALLAPPAITTLVENYPPDTTPSGGVADLTLWQTEILRLVARGLSNDQIEREPHISHAVHEAHVSALLSHLQARDHVQLVTTAYEHGLVHPGTWGNRPV